MKTKYTVLAVVALTITSVAAQAGNMDYDPIYEATRYLQPALTRRDAEDLASALNDVVDDPNCEIPWQILLSIAFNESSLIKNKIGKMVDKKGRLRNVDFGLMQINRRNILKMGLDRTRLLKDEAYSFHAACDILTANRMSYSKKYYYWIGIYRSGTRLSKEKIVKNAKSYNRMILRTVRRIGYHPHTILNINERNDVQDFERK